MEVIIHKTPDEASRAAALWFAARLRARPDMVIGLTGGRTPGMFYREVVKLHRETGVSFRGVTSFNLDEYVGVTRTHKAAFARALDAELLDLVDIDKRRTFAPSQGGEDAFERQIAAAGGIDIQFLGIGPDGHVGFNSPGTQFGARTHVTPLSRQGFIEAEERFVGIGPAPRFGVTMGMATIQDARCCLMLAFGAGKARAVAEMIEGGVSATWPASALQLHRSVVVFLDEPAASQLKLRDHHEWLQASREAAEGKKLLPSAGVDGTK